MLADESSITLIDNIPTHIIKENCALGPSQLITD